MNIKIENLEICINQKLTILFSDENIKKEDFITPPPTTFDKNLNFEEEIKFYQKQLLSLKIEKQNFKDTNLKFFDRLLNKISNAKNEAEILTIKEKSQTAITNFKIFLEKQNIKLTQNNQPSIYKFKFLHLDDKSFTCKKGDIKNSKFFSKIFTENQIANIINNYDDFSKRYNCEQDLNRFIKDNFTPKFQNFSIFKNCDFFVRFEEGNIKFLIKKDEKILPYDFPKFFSFVFELVLTCNFLKQNDYIIVDCLYCFSPKFIKELKNFIKNSDFNFIILTNNHFFVDLQNLEEIFIIKQNHKNILECKSFCAFDFLEILSFHKNLVFVEGITDYCYLSAFKNFFAKNGENFDLNFVPINGIMINKDQISCLKEFKNSIILVDGDEAGMNFETNNLDLKIFSLHYFGFATIESLFKDKKLKKDFKNAIKFKNEPLNQNEQTIKNFKMLLEKIDSFF